MIGSGTRAEQENELVVGQLLEAWGGKKAPRFAALLAAELAWSEPWFEGNLDKPRLLAHMQSMSAAIELGFLGGTTWFAGDFVVVRGTIESTAFTPVPSVGIEPVEMTAQRRFVIPVIGIFEVNAGKVRAASLVWQTASLYQQLGIPPRTTPFVVSDGG